MLLDALVFLYYYFRIISQGGINMKCPKCGYVSFEYLDQCRGCGRDLTQFKSNIGLVAFASGTINILRYVEGMEEIAEKPKEIAEPTTEMTEIPPRLTKEKNEEIELTLEPVEEKEEINLTLEGEENKVEPTPAKEKEKLSEVDEISLTLEDIAEFDEEKSEDNK